MYDKYMYLHLLINVVNKISKVGRFAYSKANNILKKMPKCSIVCTYNRNDTPENNSGRVFMKSLHTTEGLLAL